MACPACWPLPAAVALTAGKSVGPGQGPSPRCTATYLGAAPPAVAWRRAGPPQSSPEQNKNTHLIVIIRRCQQMSKRFGRRVAPTRKGGHSSTPRVLPDFVLSGRCLPAPSYKTIFAAPFPRRKQGVKYKMRAPCAALHGPAAPLGGWNAPMISRCLFKRFQWPIESTCACRACPRGPAPPL